MCQHGFYRQSSPKVDQNTFCLSVRKDSFEAQLSSVATLLEPTERQSRIINVVGVDPYRAGAQGSGHPVRALQVVGPYTSTEPVRTIIAHADHLFDISERDNPNDWPEDLFLGDP